MRRSASKTRWSRACRPPRRPSYLVGFVVAAITGFAAIKLLEYLLKSKKFYIFAAYTFIVGVVAVIFGLTR